jgi:hypothetical protein
MRALIFGCVALLMSTSLVLAEDIMVGYYGNTLVAKTATGELHIHYLADHTFNASGTNAQGPVAFKGTWTLDDKSQLCRTYDSPPPTMHNPVCTPWSAHNVGDSWTMGANVSLSLVPGIQ